MSSSRNDDKICSTLTQDNTAHIQKAKAKKEKTSLQTHVYKRRWYILFAYSFLSCTQNGLWSTWGPISESAEDAFDWTDADIALLSMWGPVSYIITAFIFSWIVDVKGLRWACLIMAFLVALGSGIRCITDQPPYVTWTVNIGQILNALAGPCSAIPPVLSATWFPANERVTATAISVTVSNIGAALMDFILGPHVVTEYPRSMNDTNNDKSEYIDFNLVSKSLNLSAFKNISDVDRKHWQRKEIMLLMYIECAWSVFVFLLLLIYFPAKPPNPPTVSASTERGDFKSVIKKLIRKGKFWLICVTYGVSVGVFSCWMSVLDVILKPHGISQKDTGWICFYAVVAGCVGSVILARFADRFIRQMKLLLVTLYIGSGACFVWFTLLIQGTLPSSKVSLYIAIALATLLLNSAVPLYFEMACEVTYPVTEGITNFVMTLVKNAGGIFFLGLLMVPSLGTGWENWLSLGAIISCVPVLLLFKERFNRLDVDEVNK